MSLGGWLSFALMWPLFGCSLYQESALPYVAGDAGTNQPPVRRVVGPGGAPIAPGDLDGGSSGSSGGALPVCTKAGQGHCCYDGQKLTGIPKCSWRRLGTADSIPISSVFRDKQKGTLPVPATLTSAAPAQFMSKAECEGKPIGFILSAPGVKEGPLSSGISHYYIKEDGTWNYAGGGGTSGLVAARNSDPAFQRDAAQAPSPTYTLHSGLCDPLAKVENRAYVELTANFDFTIDGVPYDTYFDQHPNQNETGYYAVIEKAF